MVVLRLRALFPLAGRNESPSFVGRGIGHPLRGLWTGAGPGCARQGDRAGANHAEERPSDGHASGKSKIPAITPGGMTARSRLGLRAVLSRPDPTAQKVRAAYLAAPYRDGPDAAASLGPSISRCRHRGRRRLAHDVLRQAGPAPTRSVLPAALGRRDRRDRAHRAASGGLSCTTSFGRPSGAPSIRSTRSADSVLGIKAYRSIADVPGEVDLAVMVTPPATVPAIVRGVRRSRRPGGGDHLGRLPRDRGGGSASWSRKFWPRPGGGECASSGPTASAS